MAELEKGFLSSEVSYCHSSDFNLVHYTPITVHKWPKSLFPDLFPKYASYSESQSHSRTPSPLLPSPLPPSSPEWPPLFYEASSPLPQEDIREGEIDNEEWVSMHVLLSFILQLPIRVAAADESSIVNQSEHQCWAEAYQEIEDLKINLQIAREENKQLKKLLVKYG